MPDEVSTTLSEDQKPTTVASPAAAPAGDKPAGDAPWYAAFTQGLDEPAVKTFFETTASRYKDPTSFAKSYVELRQNAIVIPKDTTKPEALNEVWKRLGRPDKPEYKWNHLADAPPLADGEVEVRNGFAPVAHRHGMTQAQVDGVVQWHDQQRKVGEDAFLARADQIADTQNKTLRQSFGADYEQEVAYHANAVKAYAASPEDYTTLRHLTLADGTAATDHPAFVRMMARIGKERAEDTRHVAQFNPSAVNNAMSEIDRIESEARSKGMGPTHPQYPRAELKKLYDRAYGTKPIPMNVVS